MSTTVATGTSDARRTSIASECASYAGVRYAMAPLGSGYLAIVGGKTVSTLGVEATINLLTVFRVTGTTLAPDGSMRYAYQWRRSTTPLLNGHAEDAQAVALTDANHAGKVLVCGGHFQLAAASSATTLILHQGPTPGPELIAATSLAAMGVARGMHRATVLTDGRVLVTGGFTTWSTPLATCQRWSTTAETWGAAASMDVPRMDHGQVLLPDGRVLVAGGLTGASSYTPSVEIYDPTGNAWSATGSLAAARAGHALVALPDGRVLAVGGTGPDGTVALTELWDPVAGTWTVVGAPATARARPAAALVPALGGVLLAGGDTTTTEIWDTARAAWRAGIATLGRVRRDCQAALLPEGVVLLPGGTEFLAAVWTTSEHSHLLAPGAEAVGGGDITGERVISEIGSPTAFRYFTRTLAAATADAGTVTPIAAPIVAFHGAHIVDPAGLSVVSSIAAIIDELLEAGGGHSSLTLRTSMSDTEPATRFPAEGGYLTMRYGYAGQAGPIRFTGRLSTVALALDPAAVLPADIQPGDVVMLLAGREPLTEIPAAAGVLVATASPSGRVAAESFLDQVVAGGVRLDKNVEYPGDRGLGAAGAPTSGAPRLSSIVTAFASDNVDAELAARRDA